MATGNLVSLFDNLIIYPSYHSIFLSNFLQDRNNLYT